MIWADLGRSRLISAGVTGGEDVRQELLEDGEEGVAVPERRGALALLLLGLWPKLIRKRAVVSGLSSNRAEVLYLCEI